MGSRMAVFGASRLFASATKIQEVEFAPDSPLEAVMSELVSVGKPPFPGNWEKYRETRLHHDTIVFNVTLYQELTSQIP
jgi:hypothetical protein